jgi:hypothetical protein
MIDIAVPRDIDPDVQHLDNVFLYNIDHLETLVRENLRLREGELARCQEIIEEKTAAVMNKLMFSLALWLSPSQGQTVSRRKSSLSGPLNFKPQPGNMI